MGRGWTDDEVGWPSKVKGAYKRLAFAVRCRFSSGHCLLLFVTFFSFFLFSYWENLCIEFPEYSASSKEARDRMGPFYLYSCGSIMSFLKIYIQGSVFNLHRWWCC